MAGSKVYRGNMAQLTENKGGRYLLAFGVSVGMVGIILFFAYDLGFRHVGFAFLVNFFILFWVTIVQRLIQLALGDSYYQPQTWEKEGKVYEWVGVRPAKRLVSSRAWRLFNKDFQFKRRGPGMLDELDDALRNAETGHLLALLIMGVLTLYALTQQWWDAVGWLLLFNILINGYPIMIQRYNRLRLHQVRQRQQKRASR